MLMEVRAIKLGDTVYNFTYKHKICHVYVDKLPRTLCNFMKTSRYRKHKIHYKLQSPSQD